MSKSRLTVTRLLEAGFKEAGCWELDSARGLTHRIDLPVKPGVYAFAIDGVVQYVGLASKSVRQRLGFYRKAEPSQRTNIRLNEIIRGHLTAGATVQILVAHPPDHEWNRLRISGAEGLEAGLIAEFDLPWNVRGSSGEVAVKATQTHESAGGAVAYFVYENWTVDKAIVHRGDCTFCNNGQGIHQTGATKNSCWYGPFASSHEALRKAKDCRRTRTEGCAFCSPL